MVRSLLYVFCCFLVSTGSLSAQDSLSVAGEYSPDGQKVLHVFFENDSLFALWAGFPQKEHLLQVGADKYVFHYDSSVGVEFKRSSTGKVEFAVRNVARKKEWLTKQAPYVSLLEFEPFVGYYATQNGKTVGIIQKQGCFYAVEAPNEEQRILAQSSYQFLVVNNPHKRLAFVVGNEGQVESLTIKLYGTALKARRLSGIAALKAAVKAAELLSE